METFAAIAVAMLALIFAINHINARYEKNKRSADADGPSPDELVESAWDEFGGDEPVALLRRRVDRLAKDVRIDKLSSKTAVVQLAVMAARAERYDQLPPLAERAESLDAGCGETRTLRALSEALTGHSYERAVEAIHRARSAVAGCSKCSSSIESQLLAQELSIAADNLRERFEAEEAARRPTNSTTPSAHGQLAVRVVRSG